jgi:hypothetical protein
MTQRKHTFESFARILGLDSGDFDDALEFLLEGGDIWIEDGMIVVTDTCSAKGIEVMGGRDVTHMATASLRLIRREGVPGRSPDGISGDELTKVYPFIAKAMQMVALEMRSNPEWERLVTSIEDVYLEPIGYFNSRSRAFLRIGF